MQVEYKVEVAGRKLIEIGLDWLQMLEDDHIDDTEKARMKAEVRELMAVALDVEEIAVDCKATARCLKVGPQNAVDGHLAARYNDIARARAQYRACQEERQREAANQEQASYGLAA